MAAPGPTYPLPPAGFALKPRTDPPNLPPRKPSNPLLPPLASPPAPTSALQASTSNIPTITTTLAPLSTPTSASSSPRATPMIISPPTTSSFSSLLSSESIPNSSSMNDVTMASNPIITVPQSSSSISPSPSPAPSPSPSPSPSATAPAPSPTPSAASVTISSSATVTTTTTTITLLDLSQFDTLSTPTVTELPTIRIADTATQRVQHDNLADLFSIIIALERLETAFVRDAIPSADYKQACAKLLAQYRTLKDAVSDVVPDVNQFMSEYNMQCRAAAARIQAATPADLGDAVSEGKELSVFHAVQHFITTMDSLKLNMKAVDELFPHLTDLMDSINKVSNLPPEHESKVKIKLWLSTLSKLRAHDELSEEQVRQMSFDLDYAYSAFHKFVQGK